MKDKKGNNSGIYIIVLTAFFLGCFLLLVIFGTKTYRNIADRKDANNEQRAILSYLLTTTKMSETEISAGQDAAYGKYLLVEDPGTGYGNRIYLFDGYLVEDYGKTDGKLYPDAATRIGRTELFEVNEISDGLLKINTDEGSVFIHIGTAGE